MTNPYRLLKIEDSADNQQIREAYLQRVREFPPDHYPEEFQQVQEAYHSIKDEMSRIKYQMLVKPRFDLKAIMAQSFKTKHQRRPAASQLLKLLETSSHNH